LLYEWFESSEVMTNVIPGAGLLNLSQGAFNQISRLNCNDYVVILGGSNAVIRMSL
jgi:hypothetical protein